MSQDRRLAARRRVRMPRGVRLALMGGVAATCLVLVGTQALALPGARSTPADGPVRRSPAPAPADRTGQEVTIGTHYVHTATWLLPGHERELAPVDVALGPDETIYVADADQPVVHVLGAADGVRRLFGRQGPGETGAAAAGSWPLAVDVDRERKRVFVVWGTVDGLEVARHDLDGRLEADLLQLPHRAPTPRCDVAVHRPTGDVLVLAYNRVVRLAGATMVDDFPVDVTVRADLADRIAVWDDGSLAVSHVTSGRVVLLSDTGVPLLELALSSDTTPLAIDTDRGRDGESANEVLHVLVAGRTAGTPDQPALLLIDALGHEIGSRSGAEMGAPRPDAQRALRWSFGIDAEEGALAFVTWDADARLEVRVARSGLPSVRQLAGAIPALPFHPHVPEPAQRDGATEPMALAMDRGALFALDGRRGLLFRLDMAGGASVEATVPADTTDMAVSEGELFLTTSGGRLVRYASTRAITPTWTMACDCRYGGGLAPVGPVVYVTQPMQRRLAAIDVGARTVLRFVSWPEAVGLWPSDAAAGVDGRLFTGDLILSQVQVWRAPSAPEVVWQAGLLAGPRRLTATRLQDGADVVTAYMADGYVEMHAAQDGNLLSRWRPVLADGTAPVVSDIGLLPDGRVVLADTRARAVQVFAAGVGPTPAPEASPPPSPTPASRACQVSGDKIAAPARIVLGETASVTLTIAARCPDASELIGADIVLVMDVSGSMVGAKLEAAKEAARNFVRLLDVRYHRVGLVMFHGGSRTLAALTTDPAGVFLAIEALSAAGGTNITAGIQTADALLRDLGRPDALPVIVLLSDGAHTIGGGPVPAAEAARARGVQIYAVGLGAGADATTLVAVAGRQDRYFYAPTPEELFPIYEQILRVVLSSLAGAMIVDDEMAEDIDYVAGSARPPALSEQGRLRWGRSLLPSSGVTFTYEILPRRPGILPTNRRAVADYNDGDGVRRQFVFPVPEIEVITPTPSPTHTPTVTPTPTMTPTPTPVPLPAFLPLVNRHHCLPGVAHADIVLLIDTSSSMEGEKIVQARTAALIFVDLLDLTRDQAAVVGFDQTASIAAPMTGDRAVLRRAIDGLRTRQGTRIDTALRAAAEVLGPGRGRRPENRAVVVLLSDGAHGGDARDVLQAADALKDAGVRVFAIGLGTDADVALLRSVADPGRYYFAPDAAGLRDIYASIAVLLPCR